MNPVLARVGLAPTVGIGNVANMIPALTAGFAQLHHARLDEVSVRLVAQHYVSHSVPRFGHAAGAPYHLTVRIHGERVNDLDADAEVFALLATRLRRLGGVEGQLLTASSAFRVLAAMATDSGEVMHAPGPAGQPGGYPVRVDGDGATVDVDLSLSLADAVRINEEGQRADGIDRIEPDGTVVFTEAEMSVMKRLLGYDCRTMSLADAPAQAEELGARYREFGPRNR